MKNHYPIKIAAFLLAAFASGNTLAATSDQEAKINEVSEVLGELNRIPERNIPAKLLRNAEGIAIIPAVVKVGIVIGGRYGKGILSIRKKDKTWSDPIFLSLKGGSIGWQIGAQSTDVILVFKTRKSLDGILKGKFTLGADAAVAAGPVGRSAEAATDTKLKAEVYSYSRSRGLFAGIALDGAALDIQNKDNANYYGDSTITASRIGRGENTTTPDSAAKLVEVLSRYTDQQADNDE